MRDLAEPESRLVTAKAWPGDSVVIAGDLFQVIGVHIQQAQIIYVCEAIEEKISYRLECFEYQFELAGRLEDFAEAT